MRGNSKAVPFHGILAMGSTQDEAVNRYRLLALGKGVSAFVDQGQSLAFVTNASSKIAEMFNPATGELDLLKDENLVSKLEFEAQAGEVEANHYVCESGCGVHIVYDSEQLVKFCPACTTAIAGEGNTAEASDEDEDEDEDEELDDDLDEDEDDEDEDDEDDEAEASDDDEDDESEEDDEDEDGDDDEDDESEEDDDSASPLVIAADTKEKAIEIYQGERQGIATAATTVEVEYKVCASAECGAHILSEEPSLSACPACDSALKEPEVQAAAEAPVVQASDDEDEDESDLEVIPDDEDEDGDDEDEEEDESESSTAKPEDNAEGNVMATAPAAAPVVASAPTAVAAPAVQAQDAEQVDINMLATLDDTGADAHKKLDVSFSASIGGQPQWTAYFEGRPVATASKASVGKNADIFEDAAFGHAAIAGAKHVGVKNILNELGFQAVVYPVSISAVVIGKVDAQVAEAKSNLVQEQTEYAERLMSAMATAAIGVNRGFFADVKNPLKEALWDVMSSAGVKNPEVAIHNAFRSASDAYHNMLFAKAGEIIAKPLEVQESLAKAVLGTNYMGAVVASADSGLEDRLSNFGTTVTASTVQETAAVQVENKQESLSSDARISNVVASLGRRR